jgi:hydroxypyruvate reductase
MFTSENFLTSSIKTHPRGKDVSQIMAAAFQSAHAGNAVQRFLQSYPLPSARRTFVFGLGKAACAMTSALTGFTSPTDTLVITKHASPLNLKPVTVIEGNHPIPGSDSLAAGRAALNFLSQLAPDDLLICLISGGGSALMTAPIIPLDELQKLTALLLSNGARIDEINTLRRHLDLLKGGGIVQNANGTQVVSLILSDVVGDPVEAIASGVTAPDPTTITDAENLVRRIGGQSYPFRETPKPNDPVFTKVQNHIISSNDIALLAAQKQAEQTGFHAEIIHSGLQGEAREVGRVLAKKIKEEKIPRPFCLLAGGEMTVTIKGSGKGGRNQELVLGAVESLRGVKDVMLISIATDGEDGPTDAAGAVATGESAQRAESLGMDTADYLSRNDAYPFFAKLDDLLKPGPSGTNVNDLIFLFGF